MKTANVIIFQAINREQNSTINIRVIWIKWCINGKKFSFKGFLGFPKSFCGIKRAFWNPCFISESG